jgi:tetratricopeptide (TPR) repeat protein
VTGARGGRRRLRHFFATLATLVVLVAAVGCGDRSSRPSRATPSPAPTVESQRTLGPRIEAGDGYRQDEDGVTVVHLRGDEAATRAQAQTLLADEIVAYEAAVARNRVLTAGGCSAFADWRAGNGLSLWHGRTFDYYGLDAMDRYRVVYFVDPTGGLPFVSVNWPTVDAAQSVHTAMNAAGVSLTYNYADSNDESIADAPQLWRLLGEVIAQAHSVDEAVALLERGPRASSANILIADASVPTAVVVELTSRKLTVRRASDDAIWCTNHFVDMHMREPIRDQNSFARYRRLRQLLSSGGPRDLDAAVAVLRDHHDVRTGRDDFSGDVIAWNINVQAEIFHPGDRTLWVATGIAPAVYGRWIGFSLDAELAGEPGEDPTRVVPPDPLLDESAATPFRLFQEGYVAYLNGEDDEAVPLLQRAVAADPRNGRYLYALGAALTAQGAREAAVEAYRRVVITDVDDVYKASACVHLGQLYEELGERARALAWYRRALGYDIGDDELEAPAREALGGGR